MIITREWQMPNKETFTIKPVAKLLKKYVGNGKNWIDPFAGDNSPAEFTNDLNPEKKSKCHLEAKDFIKCISIKVAGCLFDPPYSNEQSKRCYESVGLKVTKESMQAGFQKEKSLIAPLIIMGGFAICFGWNSGGFGKNRGFELIELLLVNHGSVHPDTIITVERKFQS